MFPDNFCVSVFRLEKTAVILHEQATVCSSARSPSVEAALVVCTSSKCQSRRPPRCGGNTSATGGCVSVSQRRVGKVREV